MFQTGRLQSLCGSALLRSFAPFCALCALLRSFALFGGLAFALVCAEFNVDGGNSASVIGF